MEIHFSYVMFTENLD